MPPSSSSSLRPPLLLPLLLLLVLPRCGAAGCGDRFLTGQRDFVLDAKASVLGGAALLGTVYVQSEDECRDVCCGESRCNLALVLPGTAEAENRTCDLFNCIYRNSFVCSFVNQAGYLSLIREPVFKKYLGEPLRRGESTPGLLENPDGSRPERVLEVFGLEPNMFVSFDDDDFEGKEENDMKRDKRRVTGSVQD